jgi:hypothetical protein
MHAVCRAHGYPKEKEALHHGSREAMCFAALRVRMRVSHAHLGRDPVVTESPASERSTSARDPVRDAASVATAFGRIVMILATYNCDCGCDWLRRFLERVAHESRLGRQRLS